MTRTTLLRRSLLTCTALLCISFAADRLVAEDTKPAANVGGVAAAEGTGSITGVVYFDGKTAPRRRVDVTADPYCKSTHEDSPVLRETYIFGKTKDDKDTLVNVFVTISKGLEGKTFDPSDSALLDQVGCVYTPHVSGVMVGQKLVVRNSDSTLHNVNMQSKLNGSLNIGQPAKGMTKEITYEKAEPAIAFRCDVHPWMGAFVHAVPHPFYAVTMEDGSFTLKGLEPGTYTVTVWHEFDKFTPVKNDIEVQVKADEASTVDFTYQPPKQN